MVYLDTSVVVALMTREPLTDSVATWFADLDEMPVSSDWLLAEFASAISIKVRSGKLSDAAAKAIHKKFDVLASGGIRLAPVSREAFKEAAALSRTHKIGVRAGDALHLAVARELGAATIATLDRTMADNAARMKLKTVGFS